MDDTGSGYQTGLTGDGDAGRCPPMPRPSSNGGNGRAAATLTKGRKRVRRERRRSSVGVSPTRQLSLRPVAIGAAREVTNSPKPLVQRAALRRLGEPAGRNNSERHRGLETTYCGSRPGPFTGKAAVAASGERLDPACGPTGVKATACRHMEIARNAGDPARWPREPTGRPRGTGRAAGGVGEVHSTCEAGESRGREGTSVPGQRQKG
jgi:hypothetical protein